MFSAPYGSEQLYWTAGHGWNEVDGTQCDSEAAIHDTHLVCGIDSDNGLELTTINGGKAAVTPLVPDTDGTISSAVVSPNHKTLTFVATEGETTRLYCCTLADYQPQRVAVFPARTVLQSWR